MTTHLEPPRRVGATLIALTVTAAALLAGGGSAGAAMAPSVPLNTSANYAVLGASTVTNTGGSRLDGSLGLWPGTSITGFPPGQVLSPGQTDQTNAAAKEAQSDLTAAAVNAAGRPLGATTTADLANLKLGAGVYAGPGRSALRLTGPLVLDGAGDPTSVFIFQTDSTLTTGSGTTVALINGAQECNVFWQVGSSATLGSDSVFTGNILALTSITVNNSVTVHGRALARNGAVTLDNDTFTRPTCDTTPADDGAGSTPGATTGTTSGGGTTGTTSGGGTTGTTSGGGTTGTTSGRGTGTTPGGGTGRTPGGDGPGVPGVVGPPRTGAAPLPSSPFPWLALLLGSLFGSVVAGRTVLACRVPAGAPASER